jgi:alkylhydroperoxidase/carboxymuconolactone decarboxylase family protein YurZ
MISVDQLYEDALSMLTAVADGDSLDGLSAAIIRFAVCVSPASLNPEDIHQSVEAALAAGANKAQIAEVMALVSGIGVHTLMVASKSVCQALEVQGESVLSTPLDTEREQLWAHYVGEDRYWQQFERYVPGFLDSLLRLSVESFKGFFQYCAIPWKTAALPATTKELIALACDATPSHRYQPGMRLHIINAVKLGVGRVAIQEALAIAASAPEHEGIAA